MAAAAATTAATATSEDEFVFSLSREEFMQIFFDDLELPNLARTEFGRTERHKSIRAGFTKTGVPANLAVIRTLTQSLARRIALGGGLAREMLALEEQFAVAVAARPRGRRPPRSIEELERLERRRGGCRSSTTWTCATATGSGGRSRSRARRCSA